jgi:hypothetical protein
MTDVYLDDLLDELVAAEPRDRWNDVLRRARRARRRYVAAVASIAALVVVPAAWAISHAFEGKPAPQSIKSAFQESNKMATMFAKALGRRQPRAIASKAHGVIQVQTADGALDLWAAPATGGGTCYFDGWESDVHKTSAFGESSCIPGSAERTRSAAHSLNISWGGDYAHREYEVLKGYAFRGATTVRLRLSDGRTKTLPVVEGLFLGAIRRGENSLRSHRGIRVVSATARNARGHVVGTFSWPAG